jgi:hypothetical protein
MGTYLGEGILSDPEEPQHEINVDNAPHAHVSLQLPGYDIRKHKEHQAIYDESPTGYSRLFCWRRVDGIVRDFTHLAHCGPVHVRTYPCLSSTVKSASVTVNRVV